MLTTGFAFVLRELLAKNNISESEVSLRARRRRGAAVQRAPRGTHAATVVLTPFDDRAGERGHQVLARADEHLRLSRHRRRGAALVGEGQ